MGIGLNAQQIKLVIDALRKGKPKKFSELKKLHLPVQKGKIPKTIPTQSLTRYLHYLQLWGLVEQDKNTKRWVWKQYTKRYNSEAEYNQHLEHSRKLSYSLKAILLIPYVTQAPPEDQLIKQTVIYPRFAEEHLETGYPKIYKKLTALRELSSRLEKLKKKFIRQLVDKSDVKKSLERLVKYEPESGILSFLSIIGYDWKHRAVPHELKPKLESYARRVGIGNEILEELVEKNNELSEWLKVALETRNKTLEVYKELLGEIEFIRLRIEMGTPLDGVCQTCPDFMIAKSEQEP